ncbi:MAG: hypothetical protein ACW99Q_24465, partial [Candidatus Kariarchaeaceae archaeon]
MVDAFSKENYTFTFKLSSFEDKPVNGSIVWLHIGFVPKSKSSFLNERAFVDDTGISPYFESLGTEEITSRGPGEGANKMFGRPLLYELEYGGNYSAYGPYQWVYGVTNEFGEVTFDVSFEEEYINDFMDIFGSIEGINSVEDIVLYIRAFSSYFDWNEFKIDDPEQYLCSKDGEIFDGSDSLPNVNMDDLVIQDSTYTEGIMRIHKKPITLGMNDYYSYNLPDPELNDPYEPITMHLYVNEADPIPSSTVPTLETLTKDYTVAELEAQAGSLLEDGNRYYAVIEFYTPSGNFVERFYKEIQDGYDSGIIEIDNETVILLLDKLGPGISTIQIYVDETDYYKKSPTIHIPLEIVPPYYVRFGKKDTQIDLIDPLISAWGTASNNGVEMPFESNYPHLIGTVWVDPDFLGTGEEKERSIQDYIEVAIDATIYNDDGTTSTFPLDNDVMLRAGNRDGIMTFDIGLGPENAFLMGLECHLNITFDINFNADDVYNESRDVEIYLLDLRLEANPSSSTPNTTWSLYDNGLVSSEITIQYTQTPIRPQTEVVYLGGTENGEIYGQNIAFLFDNETLSYSLDADSELLNLLALNQIEPLKITGIKDGDEVVFSQGTDWTMPYFPSGILYNDSFIQFTDTNLPDAGTEFSITYKLTFDFDSNNYGKITLGFTNGYNESWIDLHIKNGLPESNKSYSAMYTGFTDRFTGTGAQTQFTVNYGLSGVSSWDDNYYIIYNEQALTSQFGQFTKTVSQGRPRLTFSTAPPDQSEIVVNYGVKSQYALSYGFQKVNSTYSDSIRLMYNNSFSIKTVD